MPRRRLIAAPYYGGKNRPVLQDAILSRLMLQKGYMEPFCGSCGILLNRRPVKFELINDLDDLVVNFFKVLREDPYELIRLLELTPYSRTEYRRAVEAIDSGESLSDLERARHWYTGVSMSGRGLFGRSFAPCTAPSGGSLSRAHRIRIDENLYRIAERLRSVTIENEDGVKLIRSVADRPDWTVYCDPPYPLENRKSKAYRCESSPDLHERLLETVMEAECQVVISTYDSDLYREKLKGWHRTELEIGKNFFGMTSDIPAFEVIYANRLPREGLL